MQINNKFDIKDIVYVITDTEQRKNIIIAILVTDDGIRYELAQGKESRYHYDFEISSDINLEY